MSNKDIHKLSPAELQKALADERSELHHLRFKASNSQLNNVRDIRQIRGRIARLLTEINSRISEDKA